MKKLPFILFLSGILSAQMPTLNLLDYGSNCKGEPNMYIVYDIDIAPGGGVWVEWNHIGNWQLVQNSQHFTVAPGVDAYEFPITSTLDSLLTVFPQDSMYRFRFVDIITEEYQTIDTFYTYCPHTFSFEEYEYLSNVSVASYNIYGQPVTDETMGLIFEVYIYPNNKTKVIKKWR